jgi:hypothetical protein
MEQVGLATKCPPHVNDTGRMYSHYSRTADGELDRFAADVSPITKRRAVFLDIDDFLDDCESRINYAHTRSAYGSTVLVVFLIPTVAWISIAVEMLLHCQRLSHSKAEKALEKVAAVGDVVDVGVVGDINVSKMKYKMAGKPAGTSTVKYKPTLEETTGGLLSISETAAEKLKRKNWKCAIALRSCTKSAYFQLFKFCFGTFTTLASQQGTFLSPTNRYVTDQLLLGSAIIVSAIGTPILHVWRAKIAHVLFDGSFCLFFAGIATKNLIGFFLEEEGPTGVVRFVELSGVDLFNKSQAVVLPLLSFALLTRGHWNGSLKSVTPPNNDAKKDFDAIDDNKPIEPIVEVLAIPVIKSTNAIVPLEMLEGQSKESDTNNMGQLDPKLAKRKEKEVRLNTKSERGCFFYELLLYQRST